MSSSSLNTSTEASNEFSFSVLDLEVEVIARRSGVEVARGQAAFGSSLKKVNKVKRYRGLLNTARSLA